MNGKYKILLWLPLTILAVLFVAWCMMAIGPDGTSVLGNTKTIKGRVVDIYDGASYDVVFKLQNEPHTYYINRGVEKGLNVEHLKQQFMNKEMEVSYVSHFGSRGGHINRIMHADSIVYNELQ